MKQKDPVAKCIENLLTKYGKDTLNKVSFEVLRSDVKEELKKASAESTGSSKAVGSRMSNYVGKLKNSERIVTYLAESLFKYYPGEWI